MVPMSDGDYTFCNIREGTHVCRFREAWGNFQKGKKKIDALGYGGREVGTPMQLGNLVLVWIWKSQLWPTVTLNKSFISRASVLCAVI